MATGGQPTGPGREENFRDRVARNLADNRPFFVRYLRCTECMSHLKGVIDGFDEGLKNKLCRLEKSEGEEEANELFLQKLEMCEDHHGKWKTFINTLQVLDYETLVKLLTGTPVNSDREHYVKLVEILTPSIIYKLNPVELLDHLVAEKCINRRDVENVKCTVDNRGCIEGTELLLSRVTRLRDDWFRGFMVSLQRTESENYINLMRDIDPDFTEKLLTRDAVSQDDDTGLCAGLSNLVVSPISPGGDSDSPASASSPKAGSLIANQISEANFPPLHVEKELVLRDYQTELYTAVSRDKNTLILAPRKSGKNIVAMKILQDRLSSGSKASCKMAYLVAETAEVELIVGYIQEYLGYRPVVGFSTTQESSIFVFRAKDFYLGLKEGSFGINNFSLLIMKLDIHYFQEKQHLYKRIMGYYREFRRRPLPGESLPQLVVLTPSICGDSRLGDLYSTAMETCAQFGIGVIAMVEENLQSLKDHVSVPAVERVPFSKTEDGGFSQAIENLMSRVEGEMRRGHESLTLPQGEEVKKMSELSSPPIGRTSLKYRTWLSTNRATTGGLKIPPAYFFWNCINLLQFYQNALYISAECRSLDALDYLEEKFKEQSSRKLKYSADQSFVALLHNFKEKIPTLRQMCLRETSNPVLEGVEEKLAEIYQKDRDQWVAILVKYPAAGYSILRYLRSSPQLKGIYIQGAWKHNMDWVGLYKLKQSRFHILITTWPVLSFHLQWAQTDWQGIIRTDCPGFNMVTWRHTAQSETSQFSLWGNSVVELLMESSIESVTMEVLHLQREANNDFKESLRNINAANEQREAWSVPNPEIEEPYSETNVEFVCHHCGTFVCNHTYIRNLDDLWLGVDPKLIHRVQTVKHPAQLVFNRGYTKLGRIICKNCGQKWGIVVYVLRNPHIAFAKDGLDMLVNGELVDYASSWSKTGVVVYKFDYERDLLRCLPSTFCVDGDSIADLLKRLPTPKEDP